MPDIRAMCARRGRAHAVGRRKVTTFVPPHKTDFPMEPWERGSPLMRPAHIYTAEATVRGVTKYVKD